MSQMSLSTRNVSAVVANLKQYGERAKERAKVVVEESAARLFHAVERDTPVKSGFTRDHLRREFTPAGLGFQVGWRAEDYAAAGLDFYILYLLFGTRFMPGNDFLFSNAALERPRFRRELREALSPKR